MILLRLETGVRLVELEVLERYLAAHADDAPPIPAEGYVSYEQGGKILVVVPRELTRFFKEAEETAKQWV